MAQVNVWREGDARCLTVWGELGRADVAWLATVLSEVQSEGPALLTLDVRGLTFIDSAGIRLIIQSHQRAVSAGGRVVVRYRRSAHVARIFDLVRLDQVVEMVEAPPLRSV